MFYKINNKYRMRGWTNVPYVLINPKGNITHRLNYEEFQVLLLSDGITPYDEDVFTDSMKDILSRFTKENIVQEIEEMEEIDEEQYYQFFNNRYIKSVLWSITGRCNLNCRHCYMDAPSGKLGQITTQEAKQIIDQLRDCGIYHVDLTGGEPLVRKDFFELVDYLLDANIQIGTIYTNGMLVNESLLNQFKERNCKPGFSFSYDGLSWHDWMRGVNGAEKRVVQAIQLCVENGYPVDVEMCIHQGNRHTLKDSIDYLVQLGVHQIKIGYVTETELWKQYGNDYSLKEFVEDILDYSPIYYKEKVQANILANDVIQLIGNSTHYSLPAIKHKDNKDHSDHVLCACAYTNLYITPESRLLPCISMTASSLQSQFPLVTEQGLQKALEDPFYVQHISMREKEFIERNEDCRNCAYLNYCGTGCRANALLENEQSFLSVDQNQCFLWKEGYVERIKKVVDEAIEKYYTR